MSNDEFTRGMLARQMRASTPKPRRRPRRFALVVVLVIMVAVAVTWRSRRLLREGTADLDAEISARRPNDAETLAKSSASEKSPERKVASTDASLATLQSVASPELQAAHDQMVAALAQVAARVPDENSYVSDRELRKAQTELTRLGPNGNVNAIWKAKYSLAAWQFRVGEPADAIKTFEELMASKKYTDFADDKNRDLLLAFQLGVAYLRLAETQNCCQRYTTDSCVFPIQGRGIHEKQEPSRAAITFFTRTLENTGPNSRLHMSALWLLNIAYMTVGTYPHEVPIKYRIPPENLQGNVEFPRFRNISSDVGLGTVSLSGGIVADDFNEDGRIDVLVSNWDPTANMRLFVNQADGAFTDRTVQAGLKGIVGGLNMVHADFNNDGHVDVLVLRGAWLAENGRHPNSLLQNMGNGTFRDVTFHAGLAGEDYPTQTAAWADYDNDGFLDLYVGNESGEALDAPCQLFHNNGDGTFTDVARAAGVTNDRFTKAVVWGDFDSDSDPDIYVSNLTQPNRLFRNNGDGSFTDVASLRGVEKPLASFPAWFWDVENDGDLDLFVSSYAGNIDDIARSYLGKTGRAELAALYVNDGQGQFTNVAEEMNLSRPNPAMGANFGDLDNDGFLDFYLGTGTPEYRSLMPNAMYWNRGGVKFEDVTFAGGFGSLQKGHGVAFVDFDNDGDQDVFEQMGGALIGDTFVDALYENPGFGNSWIGLQLVGKQSNRSAIGARIRVTVLDAGQPRHIYRHVNSGGSFGANPLRQTIGLGQAQGIEALQVYWPTSRTTQQFKDVPVNRQYRIEEDSARPEDVTLRTSQ